MSKYQLVASHYNRYTGKYENEQVITMKDYDLSSLIDIDKFTCSHTNEELISMIKKENNIGNDTNTLSIRYYKNTNSSPSYFKIIIDNKIIENTLKKVKLKHMSGEKKRYAYVVDRFSEEFTLQEKKLVHLIEKRNLDDIYKLISPKSDLGHLITRYLNSSYDDENAQLEDLSKIILEFSRYKTFRGWIVANSKSYKKKNNKTIPVKPIITKKNNIVPKTIEEYEVEFEKNFEENNKITYEDNLASNYNTRDLEDDKEEFLEADELGQMGYK